MIFLFTAFKWDTQDVATEGLAVLKEAKGKTHL